MLTTRKWVVYEGARCGDLDQQETRNYTRQALRYSKTGVWCLRCRIAWVEQMKVFERFMARARSDHSFSK